MNGDAFVAGDCLVETLGGKTAENGGYISEGIYQVRGPAPWKTKEPLAIEPFCSVILA